MPKVLYTAIVADMRGSLSGSTFSRNGGGAFLRSRTAPVGQRSSFQQQRSATFISITTSWRSLTDAQREAWNDFAKDVTSTDVFGYDNRKSGFQLYCELNGNLSLLNTSAIADAPAFEPAPSRTVSNLRYDTILGGPVRYTSVGSGGGANWRYLFYGSRQLPPGRSSTNKGLRAFNFNTVNPGDTLEITGFQAAFGMPMLGERRNMKVDMINTMTGQKVSMYSDTLNIT